MCQEITKKQRISFGAPRSRCGAKSDPNPLCRNWCCQTLVVLNGPLGGVEWDLVRSFVRHMTYVDIGRRFGRAIDLQDEITMRRFFDVQTGIGEIAWVLDDRRDIAGIAHRIATSYAEAEAALIVRSDLRRQGIGEFLLRETLSRAVRQGFDTVNASIFRENRAAIRLASKIGYSLRQASIWSLDVTFELNTNGIDRGKGVACKRNG